MTHALMVQGCTSWAGKSLVTTALCRWLSRQGVKVAPFKAQNMANNARVVDGGEMGSAQWLQALAAGIEPDVRMNPLLLKPEADGSQVVVMGKVDPELSRQQWRGRSRSVWPIIAAAYDDLSASVDVVVLEGAGSPAETNLRADDIVNMPMARHADATVLVVADIDRGGAFAHLYGTWALLPEEDRSRIRGFVLNRFRGDASLLAPAPADLQELTGVPTIGVIPMLAHDLPDEDGAALRGEPSTAGHLRVAIVRYPTASNLDEFSRLQRVAHVGWASSPHDLTDADIVVLPGSKHVHHDLDWLRATGMGQAIAERAARGATTIGVCGGMQMLGRRLCDPDGVEGPSSETDGLGLLDVETTYLPDKVITRREQQLPGQLGGQLAAVAGMAFDSYEIHHGHVTSAGEPRPIAADGNTLGVLGHGLFESDAILRALSGQDPGTALEATFDVLADAVDAHLDTDLLRQLTGIT